MMHLNVEALRQQYHKREEQLRHLAHKIPIEAATTRLKGMRDEMKKQVEKLTTRSH
jgi:hypothetical protein